MIVCVFMVFMNESRFMFCRKEIKDRSMDTYKLTSLLIKEAAYLK